jgi:hypothetical protein
MVTKSIKTSTASFRKKGTLVSFLKNSLTLFTKFLMFADFIFTVI